MGRSDGRTSSHIQEGRPTAARAKPPASAPEERPTTAEGRHAGWRLAALLWAVMFLFLAALMLFDLVAGLFHR